MDYLLRIFWSPGSTLQVNCAFGSSSPTTENVKHVQVCEVSSYGMQTTNSAAEFLWTCSVYNHFVIKGCLLESMNIRPPKGNAQGTNRTPKQHHPFVLTVHKNCLYGSTSNKEKVQQAKFKSTIMASSCSLAFKNEAQQYLGGWQQYKEEARPYPAVSRSTSLWMMVH